LASFFCSVLLFPRVLLVFIVASYYFPIVLIIYHLFSSCYYYIEILFLNLGIPTMENHAPWWQGERYGKADIVWSNA
jgi:hypothetical protein